MNRLDSDVALGVSESQEVQQHHRGVDNRLCDRHLKLGIQLPPQFGGLVAVTSVQIILCRYILRKIEKENLKDKERSTWCEGP